MLEVIVELRNLHYATFDQPFSIISNILSDKNAFQHIFYVIPIANKEIALIFHRHVHNLLESALLRKHNIYQLLQRAYISIQTYGDHNQITMLLDLLVKEISSFVIC